MLKKHFKNAHCEFYEQFSCRKRMFPIQSLRVKCEVCLSHAGRSKVTKPFLVIVESAIEARFRRRSTHVPNLTGQRLKQKRQIATQPVALYDAGAAGDSYGAPLKCRT